MADMDNIISGGGTLDFIEELATKPVKSRSKHSASLTINRVLKEMVGLKKLPGTFNDVTAVSKLSPQMKAQFHGKLRTINRENDLDAFVALCRAVIDTKPDALAPIVVTGTLLCNNMALLAELLADPNLLGLWNEYHDKVNENDRVGFLSAPSGITQQSLNIIQRV
jgi:hypothetical protein